MAITFDEILLNPHYSHIARGGPEASTDIVGAPSGVRARNVGRLDQLHRYVIGYELLEPPERRDLKTFHICRDGMARGFRFKDWDDYWASADGLPDATIATPMQFGTGDGAKTQFGLYKRYTSAGVVRERRIVKPVAGGLAYDSRANTVTVYVNGVAQTSGVTVSSTTGIVTFSVAPANGAVLAWTGEFDVPVTFASDWFSPAVGDAVTVGEYNDLELTEVLPVEFDLAV
jgi:uncharacterized protein (TIGR02217 family)